MMRYDWPAMPCGMVIWPEAPEILTYSVDMAVTKAAYRVCPLELAVSTVTQEV